MDSYGQKYIITFIDDYSRYVYLYMLHNKSKALEGFKVLTIKIVGTDKCGECHDRCTKYGQAQGSFVKFLQQNGIVVQYAMPGSPKQNGVEERRNQPNIIGHGA